MKVLRIIALAVLAVTALATPAEVMAGSATLSKIKETGSITIGYRESSIPFSYLDHDQRPVGFSLDLCAPIVDRIKSELKLIDLSVKYIPVSSSSRIPLIQNGTVDMECGATSSSLARQKQVNFTVATFVSQPRWLTKSDSAIANVAGLKGKVVVVTQGSNAAPIAHTIDTKESLGLTILQAKDHAESFLMLSTGRAAAFLEDDILLAGLKANASDPGSFKFLPEAFGDYYYGLLLPKGDDEFKALADKVLEEMMSSGEFTKIYEKWFVRAIPPHNLNLEFPIGNLLKERIAHPSDKVYN
jgi:glutamate/aspartate transport system substrate-binding protein